MISNNVQNTLNYVYKYVLNGEIIYIGITKQALQLRINQHGRENDNIDQQYWEDINKADIYYLEFDSGLITDIVETCLINKYKPKCNKGKLVEDFSKYRIQYEEYLEEWKEYRINNIVVYKPPEFIQINKMKDEEIKTRYKKNILKIINLVKLTLKNGNVINKTELENLKLKLNMLIRKDEHNVDWILRAVKFNGKFCCVDNNKYLFEGDISSRCYDEMLINRSKRIVSKKYYGDDKEVIKDLFRNVMQCFGINRSTCGIGNINNFIDEYLIKEFPYHLISKKDTKTMLKNGRRNKNKNKQYWYFEKLD